MKKPFKTVGIVVAILIVAGVALRIITRGRGETEKSITEIQKQEGVPVRLETVEPQSLERTLRFSGTLEGEEQAVIVARIMETVEDIPVRVGERVSRGQVVARLNVTNPQAQYTQAQLSLNNARTELDRIDTLYAQGAVSKQALDQARLAYNLARSAFNAASELVELRSPVDGEVVRVHLRTGDVTRLGEPVVTIAKSRRIRVRFFVTAEERREIHKGQEAFIHVEISDTTRIPGVVDKVEDAADPSTRLFEITLLSNNPGGALKPGVLTALEIVVEQRDQVLAVNSEAISQDGQSGDYLFVMNDSKHAEKRQITTGLVGGNRTEVTRGLEPGEAVVVYGQNRLADGDLVKEISD